MQALIAFNLGVVALLCFVQSRQASRVPVRAGRSPALTG
jgi:hypothetical protein